MKYFNIIRNIILSCFLVGLFSQASLAQVIGFPKQLNDDFSELPKGLSGSPLFDASGKLIPGEQMLYENDHKELTTVKDFISAYLKGQRSFFNLNLQEADLPIANLRETQFIYANLSKANLRSTDLTDSYFTKSDLYQTNLTEAKLIRASLHQTNLTEAILHKADLRFAYLGVNLTGADLTEADLRGADLRFAILTETDLTGAKYDNQTLFPDNFDPIFPNNFDPKSRGMVFVSE